MDFAAILTLQNNAPGKSLQIKYGETDQVMQDSITIAGKGDTDVHEVAFNGGRGIFIGDPVFHKSANESITHYLENRDAGGTIRTVDGFFFLVIYYEADNSIIITSSLFSILPLYFSFSANTLKVSSSYEWMIRNGASHLVFDERYYLEKALFNYPLFERTPISGIGTIPSNSFLTWRDNSFTIEKHTHIYDYYVSDPEPWKKALEKLAQVFIESASAFIPDDEAVISLTGGFDSRTVLGIVLGRGKIRGTYSYGNQGDYDVEIPAEISAGLNLKYTPVVLDYEYAKTHFLSNALEFLELSDGLGNLSRAHYSYALGSALKDVPYLMSGNFGSELLRSVKIPGVVTSQALFDIFKSDTPELLRERLLSNPALKYLNKNLVDREIDGLVEEITQYLGSLPDELTTNQRFYTYVFDEVFRKYFGAEIRVQRRQLNHRAPFMCFRFIEAILKTGLAGANSDFQETNPFRRFHGQILYASILEKLHPALNNYILDRRYRPHDLLSATGKARIFYDYFARKIFKPSRPSSPGYLTSSLASANSYFRAADIDDVIFNTGVITEQVSGEWINDQINYANMISAVIYKSILNGKISRRDY